MAKSILLYFRQQQHTQAQPLILTMIDVPCCVYRPLFCQTLLIHFLLLITKTFKKIVRLLYSKYNNYDRAGIVC